MRKLSILRGFRAFRIGLHAPKTGNFCEILPKVSSRSAEYSHFWETLSGDFFDRHCAVVQALAGITFEGDEHGMPARFRKALIGLWAGDSGRWISIRQQYSGPRSDDTTSSTSSSSAWDGQTTPRKMLLLLVLD